ncbi:NrdH-redoxin [Candidatus Uhrbacteria bacterium CG_4_10_14_0_2_um_filter_41_7]|uniref:NrdH-redoxin n=1 Tax=Candidatus Uhrbacteria bacterium CG_4_9_14_3_um_filter_41_35 TaxID=1975034 RepID=A0A2M7XFL5_9BACT|nr:MAG: NrdH-redoxin [Candidatus Uhrbacteria bacterium CG11_big_fil_rev_8_21_14_0_20_41_9]PIY48631.1 MAG: NrdH-redoxin [Armatimonadetes bacterium CG_4_10_14_3_um_filter_59_10]PIZ54445.1 MAG: NrdH-redoxin [Candidatus Uhrbacteria bacterium CG_4_10_14_0_2_um_filter_41_7]PJA46526.1 MAG: NrdH-redoxin [Candidatus Uhrbacteria bacterium CG_4_9_14_3_um_filter_41_35]
MQVTVYSTPTCPWCKKIKAFLSEHSVEFNDIDVSADQVKAAEMIEKSGQMGVPVLEIGDDLVIGYDEARVSQLLNL